ncbi:MAG: type III pantothenate kinase [Gammaproteobacteria bacterium]|nr:type III pantothenate kinase [Gammaproteobacteria bacterium]
MKLLVDAGNTRIKWAWVDTEALQWRGAIPRRGGGEDADALSAAWGDRPAPLRLLVANVSGAEFRASLTAWSRRAWGIEPEFVRARAEGFGVINAYPDPQRLGVDRWLALIAARRAVAGPVCVIDCGTALTIDAMTGEGGHLGGLILPGLGLMRRALLENTSDIQAAIEDASPWPVTLLAKDTHGGVMGGTLYAAVATIDRVVRDLGAVIEGRPTCLLTGGDGAAIGPLLSTDFDFRHEPDLVLRGLAIVAEAA